MDEIVKSVPGIFSFIGSDGRDLRDLAMELNDSWSMYIVKRNGDNARLSELEKTLEKIKREGADRQSMTALESMSDFGPLNPRYPLSSYTLKPSMTNSNVAVEEVSSRIVDVVKSMIKNLVEFIRKALKMIKEHLPKFMNRRKQQAEKVTERMAEEKPTDFVAKNEGEENDQLKELAGKVEGEFNQLLSHLTDSADRMVVEYKRTTDSFHGYLVDAIDELSDITQIIESLQANRNVTEKQIADVPEKSAYQINEINRFSSYLGTKVEDNREAMRAIRDWISTAEEKSERLDAYDFDRIKRMMHHLEELLTNDKGALFYSDRTVSALKELGDRLEDSASKMNDAADRMHPDANSDWPDVRKLINSVAGINELHTRVIRFFEFGDTFYNQGYRFYVTLDGWLAKAEKK
ncbi:hypothetical protein 2050HW_00014 [Serratia phage vB_SmaM_ 2050HW]|uniref:Uncharacterized protein n=1 Tax=Serratia phage vB_SmaM_ 2050HW TaxID=2024252 RepID=A0A289YYK5_9CAUD|nr:hypothetical protein HWB23_gp014 [Serratia phage vB_SmaM_ 2050HW]ATA65349.1 hypothetical protein 2050HW_00014 [Serratia phage vB_SmaM_ 2050HW]URG14205.1 hypothetical protein [Pectobacterium phage vB_ParM-25]